MKRLHLVYLFVIPLLALLAGPACKPRITFTGANIPESIKTISIQQFENNADIVVPSLSQDFSDKLRDVFLSRSNFKLVDQGGDLNIFGEITRYDIAPMSITGNDLAAQNRLTINVRVTMECEKDETLAWEQQFSNFEDFSADEDLSSIETDLIESVNDKISQDIFNKAFANW